MNMKTRLDRRFLARGLGLLVFFVALLPLALQAQLASNGWSIRQRIPGSHDQAGTPVILADSSGTVHAFLSQPLEGSTQRAVFYSNWRLDAGWSFPVDVLLPQEGPAIAANGVVLDEQGIFHLVFSSGNNLYYTSAPALRANRAPAWTSPVLIGTDVFLEIAALTGDGRGNLVLLYGGQADGRGVYGLRSTDGGATWSTPELIFLTLDPTQFAYGMQITMDPDGNVYGVWAVNNPNGAGQAAYFTSLPAGQETWTDPFLLSEVGQVDGRLEGNIGRIGWPSIAAIDGRLMVIYMVCDPCERRVRVSDDGGRNWSGASEPYNSRGEYGWADFAVDSSNRTHMLIGDRGNGLTLWHAVWLDNSWQNMEAIAPVTEASTFVSGPLTYHPWFPRLAMVQGSILLAVWTTDEGAANNGAWFAYKFLETPTLAAVPLPTPPPERIAQSVTAVVEETAPPAAEPTSAGTAAEPAIDPTPPEAENPYIPLIAGIIPVALLILVVVGRQYWGNWRARLGQRFQNPPGAPGPSGQ